MPQGGLLQVVAYGAQNVYLTASPEITYFKISYRRHTNFAIESVEIFSKVKWILIKIKCRNSKKRRFSI